MILLAVTLIEVRMWLDKTDTLGMPIGLVCSFVAFCFFINSLGE
jgi:hypothetical protein